MAYRTRLPPTQPGLSRDEGVFLVTQAGDGSRLIFFIAQDTSHGILPVDVQLEQQLNPLWPVRLASPDEVLAFAEAAPIGNARAGLLDRSASAGAPDSSLTPTDSDSSLPAADSDSSRPAAAATNSGSPDAGGRSAIAAPESVDAEPSPTVVADETPPEATTEPVDLSYTVRPGDSAFIIARRFKIAEADLLAANSVPNRNRIYIGQVLSIPG